MKLPNAVKQRIINLKIDNHMNLKQLSEKGKIKYSTIESFMNGKTRIIKVDTFLKVCDGFNISPSEFFDDKLFKDVVDEYEKNNK